ncbi:MAG: TolC family protein [Bacteroidales bacterium]|nr:TolC family protein [Bacteroidales bacterium]
MRRIHFLSFCLILCTCLQANAKQWTLRECIDYARSNNLQVKNAQLAQAVAEETLLQAQASRFPTLNASSSQNMSFQYGGDPAYNGNYAIQTGVTLFNGGRIVNNIRQAEINAIAGEYDIDAAKNDIEVAVTQAYLNILYAKENVTTAQNNLESARAQWERAREMYGEGSISLSEYAQMESQYSSDMYQLAVSESSLAQYTLNLKQLLELGLDEDFEVFYPEIGDEKVIAALPSVGEVYKVAEDILPNMRSGRLGIDAAKLSEDIAAAAGIPSISASASMQTGNIYGVEMPFTDQLRDNLGAGVGVTLSVPIVNNRSVKTAKAKARLNTQQAELSYANSQKNLLSTLEGLYQDVVSAQSRYQAALKKLQSAELSYNLVSEKYNEGMIDPVELLTEKNTYIAAQQELLQAKYQAILCRQLLNFYQGIPIEI